MQFKIERYHVLRQEANEVASNILQRIQIQIPEMKRVAGIEGNHDNWAIFESMSEHYKEAKMHAASFESIRLRAERRLMRDMDTDIIQGDADAAIRLRDELLNSLLTLSKFSSQWNVVEAAVDIVSCFIKDPIHFRTKLMNFMLVGRTGSGKTTLASAIGDVFAKAGIFVGDSLIHAGRAELVAQYEGQTVARTRRFLIDNLDNGVIFIDEAYAITPWDNGKPEGYGSEASTAMVEFMSRYQGLYCIIVAGYETEMVRYFLPANEGLSRRFPNKFLLPDMTADQLVNVFKRSLLLYRGMTAPEEGPLLSSSFFCDAAWSYLHSLITMCKQGTEERVEEYDPATKRVYNNVLRFRPRWTHMHALVANQAGSMTILADEAITVLMRVLPFSRVALHTGGDRIGRDTHRKRKEQLGNNEPPFPLNQPVPVMRQAILNTIHKTCLSDTEVCLSQMRMIESMM